MPGLLAGDSDWTFTLRGIVHDSDPEDGSFSGDNGSETQLLKDLDLSSREDTAQYKPNPWSIARLNAACRPTSTPSAEIFPSSISKDAEKLKQTSLVQAFSKQAASRGNSTPKISKTKKIPKEVISHRGGIRGAENDQTLHVANYEPSKARKCTDRPLSTSKESFTPRTIYRAPAQISKVSRNVQPAPLHGSSVSSDQDQAPKHPPTHHGGSSPTGQDITGGYALKTLVDTSVLDSIPRPACSTPPTHIVNIRHSQPAYPVPLATAACGSQYKLTQPDNEIDTIIQNPRLNVDLDEVSSELSIELGVTERSSFPATQERLTPLRPGQRIEAFGNASSGTFNRVFCAEPLPTPSRHRHLPFKAPVQKIPARAAAFIQSSYRPPQRQNLFTSQLSQASPVSQSPPTEIGPLSMPAPIFSDPPVQSILASHGSPTFARTPATHDAHMPTFYHKPEVQADDPRRDVYAPLPLDKGPAIQYATPQRPSPPHLSSSPSPSPATCRRRISRRPMVTAYATLPEPDADIWSTLPARKKLKSSESAMKKTGKFTIPGLIPMRTRNLGGNTTKTKRKVTLYRPPPLQVEHGAITKHEPGAGVTMLKLRKVGREEAEDLRGTNDMIRRVGQEQGEHRTDFGQHQDVDEQPGPTVGPDSDLTMVDSSPPTSVPSSPSPTIVLSLPKLKDTYPTTRKVISKRKRASGEAFELLCLESCGVVKKDRKGEETRGGIEIMRWEGLDGR